MKVEYKGENVLWEVRRYAIELSNVSRHVKIGNSYLHLRLD
jgi:hypothetical protein